MNNTYFDPRIKRASLLSMAVALSLFMVKFYAYRVTGSQAIFSEAMESIVNVLAAIIAFFVLIYSAKPADREHPYGHGKIEYLSAGLEGGLIAFAAFLIVLESAQAFFNDRVLHHLDFGLMLLASTAVVNLLTGYYLNRLGRELHSPSLEASGRHLMADFWTTAGVLISLTVVLLTDLLWLDVVIALLVGIHLVKEGYSLVRKSIAGLLDEEQTSLIVKIQNLINEVRQKGIIQVHHLRVMRAGRYHHIDAHVVVPEFWSVEEAHDQTNAYEQILFNKYPFPGEIHFHVDPCRRLYCRFCNLENCTIRKEQFEDFRIMSVQELTSKDEPPLKK